MNRFGAFIASGAILTLCLPAIVDPAPAIHYAPAENFELVDAALIDTARDEIDMAAYVLSYWPVIQALSRAAKRGVKVRVFLDGTQLAKREPAKVFHEFAETLGVEIRVKRNHGSPMHLKSYQIEAGAPHRCRELFCIWPQAPGQRSGRNRERRRSRRL